MSGHRGALKEHSPGCLSSCTPPTSFAFANGRAVSVGVSGRMGQCFWSAMQKLEVAFCVFEKIVKESNLMVLPLFMAQGRGFMDADLIWGLLGDRASWRRASNRIKKANALMTMGSPRSEGTICEAFLGETPTCIFLLHLKH